MSLCSKISNFQESGGCTRRANLAKKFRYIAHAFPPLIYNSSSVHVHISPFCSVSGTESFGHSSRHMLCQGQSHSGAMDCTRSSASFQSMRDALLFPIHPLQNPHLSKTSNELSPRIGTSDGQNTRAGHSSLFPLSLITCRELGKELLIRSIPDPRYTPRDLNSADRLISLSGGAGVWLEHSVAIALVPNLTSVYPPQSMRKGRFHQVMFGRLLLGEIWRFLRTPAHAGSTNDLRKNCHTGCTYYAW